MLYNNLKICYNFRRGVVMSTSKKYKKGSIVRVTVSGITDYGIFVKLDDRYNGLIHISEISKKYVKDPNKYAKINDVISAEILSVDERDCQVKMSIKNINYKSRKVNKRVKIVETQHGFETLWKNLPFWIEENLKKVKNITKNK